MTIADDRAVKVYITLYERVNAQGVRHKYREDELANPDLQEIAPVCDELHPVAQKDRRDFLLHGTNFPSHWCSQGCFFFPEQILREPR